MFQLSRNISKDIGQMIHYYSYYKRNIKITRWLYQRAHLKKKKNKKHLFIDLRKQFLYFRVLNTSVHRMVFITREFLK